MEALIEKGADIMSKAKQIHGGPEAPMSEECAERCMRFLAECWLKNHGLTGEITVRKKTPEELAAEKAKDA